MTDLAFGAYLLAGITDGRPDWPNATRLELQSLHTAAPSPCSPLRDAAAIPGEAWCPPVLRLAGPPTAKDTP